MAAQEDQVPGELGVGWEDKDGLTPSRLLVPQPPHCHLQMGVAHQAQMITSLMCAPSPIVRALLHHQGGEGCSTHSLDSWEQVAPALLSPRRRQRSDPGKLPHQ